MCVARQGFMLFILLIGMNELYAQNYNTSFLGNWNDDNLVNHFVRYNDIWGYADQSGREYAIIGSRHFTHFIDVTNPESPIEVDRELGGTSCIWRDYKTFGQYLYGVSDQCNGGLEIFDLSYLPDSVHKVYDSDFFFNDAHNLFIDTARAKLYACGLDAGTTDLVILDLSTSPDNPSLIKNLNLPEGYVHDLYVRNDTAYCSHIYTKKLIVYDLSDPENIQSLGMYTSPGDNHSNWLSDNGDLLVLADETFDKDVMLLDMTNIEFPDTLSTFRSTLLAPNHTNSIAHNPFFVGNSFIVMSYYDDGLQIFKLDSSMQVHQVGYYDTDTSNVSYSGIGAWGVYPFLPSGNLLVSDIEHGLFVVSPQFPLVDCNSNVLVQGKYDISWNFISRDSLSIDAQLLNSETYNLFAPNSVTLLPGFDIENGTSLSVQITDQCAVVSPLSGKRPLKPGNQKEN